MYLTFTLIVALPAFLAVTFPFLDTVATLFLLVVHFWDLIFFTFFFLIFNVTFLPAVIETFFFSFRVAFLEAALALAVLNTVENAPPVSTIASASAKATILFV